jgi:hypothetical protein
MLSRVTARICYRLLYRAYSELSEDVIREAESRQGVGQWVRRSLMEIELFLGNEKMVTKTLMHARKQ